MMNGDIEIEKINHLILFTLVRYENIDRWVEHCVYSRPGARHCLEAPDNPADFISLSLLGVKCMK